MKFVRCRRKSAMRCKVRLRKLFHPTRRKQMMRILGQIFSRIQFLLKLPREYIRKKQQKRVRDLHPLHLVSKHAGCGKRGLEGFLNNAGSNSSTRARLS